MSAYVVEKETIDRVVHALLRYARWKENAPGMYEDRHDLGRKLWALNLRSVAERYERTSDGPQVADYRHGGLPPTMVQGYMSLRCYLYQSCEGDCSDDPLYEAVDAACDAIAHSIARGLAEERNAVWG